VARDEPRSFATPEACEAAFYAAFERCDAVAMMAVWAERAPLLCIHPSGPALTTREAVAQSWERIFRGAGRVRFELSGHLVCEGADVAVRSLRENIHFGPELGAVSVVLATNVYVRENDGWKMSVHHASPDPGVAAASRGGGTVH
jgi:ketosteroid isomerase-like protein